MSQMELSQKFKELSSAIVEEVKKRKRKGTSKGYGRPFSEDHATKKWIMG